jgi:putative AlgH/UPF0301 family transcriptional regulator
MGGTLRIPVVATKALIFFAIVVLADAFVSTNHRCINRSSTPHLSSADEDWRDFRAKLVQNGLPSLDNDSLGGDNSDRTTTSNRYAHITTPLVEVGSILVSIPTTDLCQALDQQYWHRSVVLITEVSDNLVHGNIEQTVPDEELAMGEKRGKWSYRGLMLNRATNSMLLGSDDDTSTLEEYERDTWIFQRGGDLLGLNSNSGTQFACLHQFGQQSDAASSKLVGNISYTTLSIAQALCKENPTKYHPDDFMTFDGFCSWRPGQLEREMGEDRLEWIVLSVDWQSIWDELQLQREKASQVIAGNQTDQAHEILLDAGTAMWRHFLQKIDMPEEQATSRLTAGQLEFYDEMLKVWAEEQLVCDSVNKDDDDDDDSFPQTISNETIRPGAIVRAKSPPTNDMLLYDTEFLQSTILVLDETPDCTVGVILNHPMSAAIECKESEDPIPIRYGGPIDIETWRDGSYLDEDYDDEEDDELYEGFMDYQSNEVNFEDLAFDDDFNDGDVGFEDDESSFLWIHRSSALGLKKVGSQLGSSKFWLIKEDEALEHIQSGTLQLHELMVFSSVSIWEKGPEMGLYGGGLREQVDALRSMEVVDCGGDDQQTDAVDAVWQILANQSVLTKESLDKNIDATIKAWGMCSGRQTVQNHDRAKERLSRAALTAYLARNFLDDPLNTLVEL